MPKKCKDSEVDIAVLDTRVKSVESFVEDMNKNHLPHIYEKLHKIDNRLAYYAGGIAVLIIIINLVIPTFFK